MGGHFLLALVSLIPVGLAALVIYGLLRGIRWAVANGIRDAQKMAERDRLAATQATTTQMHPDQDTSGNV